MIVTENIRTYEQKNVVILKGCLNTREQKEWVEKLSKNKSFGINKGIF
jgi:hypothetical protein